MYINIVTKKNYQGIPQYVSNVRVNVDIRVPNNDVHTFIHPTHIFIVPTPNKLT